MGLFGRLAGSHLPQKRAHALLGLARLPFFLPLLLLDSHER